MMEEMSEAQTSEVSDNTMAVEEDEIWEEIVDFVIWEFCIEVHRAAKLNYLYLDPDLDPEWDENKKREAAAKDDPGRSKPDRPVCLRCKKQFGGSKYFGKHLLKCFAAVSNEEESGRKDTQESDTKCGTSDNTGRKTSQKSCGQKKMKSNARDLEISKIWNHCDQNYSRFPRLHCIIVEMLPVISYIVLVNKDENDGNSSKSSGEDNDIFKNMTYEEINQFLVEKCGVLTRSKKRCGLVKCAHSCEAKELVRRTCLKNPGDNAGNYQMDQHAEKGNL